MLYLLWDGGAVPSIHKIQLMLTSSPPYLGGSLLILIKQHIWRCPICLTRPTLANMSKFDAGSFLCTFL